MPLLALLLHTALMLASAPILAGLLARAGARMEGRDGPAVAQPWRDLRRLWRKQALRPEGSGWVFVTAPGASLACVAAAALLVPSFALGMATAPVSDLVLLAGLLGLSRAVEMLAAYDAGAPIPAERVALTRLVADPALLLLILAAALSAGTTNLDGAVAVLREGGPRVSLALAWAGLAATLLASSVAPPAIDACSGRDLAILQLAGQVRRVVLLSLLAAVFLPIGLAPDGSGPAAWSMGACCWAVKMGLLGLGLAVVTPLRARLRPLQAPELAGLGLLLAALAVAAIFAGQRAA